MKCLICGNDMQCGCIQSRDGVFWSEKEYKIPSIRVGGGEIIKLNNNDNGSLSDTSAEAWLCKKCKMVVINYDKDKVV